MLQNDLKEYLAIELWPTRPDIVAIATTKLAHECDSAVREEDILTKEDAKAITETLISRFEKKLERYKLMRMYLDNEINIDSIDQQVRYHASRLKEYTEMQQAFNRL